MTLAVLLASAVFASALDLKAPFEAAAGPAFSGLTISMGAGRRVTARLTFDRNKAASGGFIYIAARVDDDAAQAVRLSQAVVTTSGGRLSRAAALARARGIPALVLGAARWEEGGVLALEQPLFGKPVKEAGLQVQAVEKTGWLRLHEGDVVSVDPLRGELLAYAAGEQQTRLDAAEAAQAYDGLHDGQALLQWLAGRTPAAGLLLLAELAERIGDGSGRGQDLAKLSAAVGPDFKEEELKLYLRQERRVTLRLQDAVRSVRSASSLPAVDRIETQGEELFSGLQWLASAFGQSARLNKSAELSSELRLHARLRRQALAGRPPADALVLAAEAAGAQLPPRAALGPELYLRFIDENGLRARLEELASDVSLPLPRRSQRIQALLLAAPLAPDSTLGREILSAAPAGEVLSVRGLGEHFGSVPRERLLDFVKQAWAAGWDPSALGRRKRSGGSIQPEARVSVEGRIVDSVSGRVFSRDPASGRRERIVVEASAKDSPASDEYTLERGTGGEVLPALLGGGKRLLSARDLAALAKAARALEDQTGAAMEAAFAFSGKTLYLLGAEKSAGSDEAPAGPAPFTVAPQAPTVPSVLPLPR